MTSTGRQSLFKSSGVSKRWGKLGPYHIIGVYVYVSYYIYITFPGIISTSKPIAWYIQINDGKDHILIDISLTCGITNISLNMIAASNSNLSKGYRKNVNWFQKGTLSHQIILIKCLQSTASYYTILYIQEVNEIWYPGRAIINLLRYKMSLTSCTKWQHLMKRILQ